MRITPVTGDLPAVAACAPPPLLVRDPPAAPPDLPAPAAVTTAGTSGSQSDPSDRRRPARPAFFDPPLIAQRAALGLPIGPLVADLATSTGISYGEASAAVDRELPSYDTSG